MKKTTTTLKTLFELIYLQSNQWPSEEWTTHVIVKQRSTCFCRLSGIFAVFLNWYNDNVVVPTLEARQKLIVFYHSKRSDMLKLGCTLHKFTNNCEYKSTTSTFYPFSDTVKGLLEKMQDYKICGHSIVFTRKVVVDTIFIRNSTRKCFVDIDASQLYTYSMCPAMPTSLEGNTKVTPSVSQTPKRNRARLRT